VYVYPETVAVKVTMDNGEIIGFDGDEYLFNQSPLPNTKPSITVQQAKSQVNPHFHIQKTRLVVIYSEGGKKVLCYELLGYLEEMDQYRIFINAHTGDEEWIEKIKKAE
jgi:spore germination protein